MSVFVWLMRWLHGLLTFLHGTPAVTNCALGGGCGRPPCHCQPGHYGCGRPPRENDGGCATPPCGEGGEPTGWRRHARRISEAVAALLLLGTLLMSRVKHPLAKAPIAAIHGAPRTPRVAFVSVFGTACGIATYNEELLAELRKYAEVQVFAERLPASGTTDREMGGDPEWVTRCWNRDEHPKRHLVQAILAWGADIVHFGHEYGFFKDAYFFTSLVSDLKRRGIQVMATMHSVYEHLDKSVQEAALPLVVVHTEAARECLLRKGLRPGSIRVIPHGTNVLAGTPEQPHLLPKLWNSWGSPHTLYQPGFLFGYKGHLRVVRLLARLKMEFPDVHYIIQGSQNAHTMGEHDRLAAEIWTEADRLGVAEHLTLLRGFEPKKVLLSYIRTARAVILPYAMHPDHEVRATSGIARLVVGTETPLLTSAVHLFDDVADVSLQFENDLDDEAMYQAIRKVFRDRAEEARQIKARQAFLKATAWPEIARQHAALYEEFARA